VNRSLLSPLLLLALACQPSSMRPYFPPVTGAAQGEIELEPRNSTAEIVAVLKSDSLPLGTVALRDGFVETEWFDARTRRPTAARRLGPDVVQVRAWVDPSRRGYSRITIETVYRPLADPSLASRDLDRQVPPDHPIGKRMGEVVRELVKLYSHEPEPAAPRP
jgi:hypothetical protein